MADTTLTRYWDSANKKHIYTDCADCTYDECWDSATKTHGVYCDSTFYPRCWNGTNWQVTVPCCEEIEMVERNCCGTGCTQTPKYLTATISGLDCPERITGGSPYIPRYNASIINGTYILQIEASGCGWRYDLEFEPGRYIVIRAGIYARYCEPQLDGTETDCPTGHRSWALIASQAGQQIFSGTTPCVAPGDCSPCWGGGGSIGSNDGSFFCYGVVCTYDPLTYIVGTGSISIG